MSADQPFQIYQNNSVNTASSGELTLKLYNGCIKFIRQAIKETDNENFEAKNTNVQKAQNIIQELMVTLDPNIDISHNMMSLYDYIAYQLKEGNIKNDTELLEEALNFVIEFRDTWKEVIKQNRAQYTEGARV